MTQAHGAKLQRGFTLLEALVTIVIISIGLLGLLKLQSASLVNTQISAARSQATIAADNMADRIRANPRGAAKGGYANAGQPDTEAAPKACINGTVCPSEQMAVFDTQEWHQTLSQTLPAGSGSIRCSQTNGAECREYTITVAWHERDRSGGQVANDNTQCSADDSAVERCFQTVVRP